MKQMQFPGGETHISMARNDQFNEYVCHWFTDADTMAMLQWNEIAKRSNYCGDRWLKIPYLPYVRQDRIINELEPFSLKIFADIINSCGFIKVYTNDVHSVQAFGLINNLISESSVNYIERVCKNENIHVLVCPDKGAIKRVREIGAVTNLPIIYADKVRDIEGHIIKTDCFYGDIKGKNVLIPDDCIAGGRTFTELAAVLRTGQPKSITLAVTHIDDPTKLQNVLKNGIDRIYHNDARRPDLTENNISYRGY